MNWRHVGEVMPYAAARDRSNAKSLAQTATKGRLIGACERHLRVLQKLFVTMLVSEMPKKPRAQRKRPIGIFVYLTADERKRIDRVRRFTRRTLSGYLLYAAMKQVSADEAEMARQAK
jgi:hypothetical protein